MAAKEKTYKCLNPVGIRESITMFQLAPRLDKLDGKTVHLCICGEPDVTIPLEKKMKMDYPDVNWTVKKTYDVAPIQLSEEEMKTTDGAIVGVAW